MASMFREAPAEDGTPGPVSMRRVLAFTFSLAGVGLFALALLFAQHGWAVFLPGIACLTAAVILLFFTTWGDVAAVAAALRGRS